VLDYADRHGMVIIDETAAVGLNMLIDAGIAQNKPKRTFGPEVLGDASQAALAQHVRELIARDKNHPSVVMWSLINEPASNEEGSREFFEPIVELARELDPTRPLTYSVVLFATAENDKIADMFDVISLNRYFGWYITPGDLVTAEHYLRHELGTWEKFGKPIMVTEYGADTQPGAHSVWDAPWTEEYQAKFLDTYHRVFDEFPFFVGEQVWNFADFQTSNGTHRVEGNKKGVFTRDRKPKAAAHELRRRWTSFANSKPGTADAAE
jgi:beta-glucuronidase